jgi:hypothetical protein
MEPEGVHGRVLLNVIFIWLVLLLHIRKILGSNLGLGTAYPEFSFVVFLCPFKKMVG